MGQRWLAGRMEGRAAITYVFSFFLPFSLSCARGEGRVGVGVLCGGKGSKKREGERRVKPGT